MLKYFLTIIIIGTTIYCFKKKSLVSKKLDSRI